MAQDDHKPKHARSPSLGGEQRKVDVRTTAMGLPSTSQHFVDDEGWQMVPLSDLDPLPDFPASHTPSSNPQSQADYEYEGESTDVKQVPKAAVVRRDINVDLNPIELAPVRKKPVVQDRSKVAKETRDDLKRPQEFNVGLTDVSETEVAKDVGRVRVVAGPNVGEERFINGPHMTIGRALDNTFMTLDLAMSRKHFLIQRGKNDDYWVRDNGSANGTYVNGVRLTDPVMLIPGDRIEAGESILEFVDAWRPVHDTRPRFGNVGHQQKQAQKAAQVTAGVADAAPFSSPETASTEPPKKKFAVAWLFAILSLVVAIGALVFALVANPPFEGKNPTETAYIAATDAKRDQAWDVALHNLQEVKRLDPNFENIDQEMEMIERELQSSRALETAQALIKRESYATAIGELDQVPKESVYYAQAQTLLKDAQNLHAQQPAIDDSEPVEEDVADDDAEKAKAPDEKGSDETISLDFEPDDTVEKDDEEDGLDLDLGSKEPEQEPEEKPKPKPKKIVKKVKRIKKKAKPKKPEPVEEDDDDGFDLDLGSSKKEPAKKKKKAAKKKPKKKPVKKAEEDDDLSIW